MSGRVHSLKPLKDLCLLDDFLFSVAMEDLEFCKTVLEIILDKKIVSIKRRETQKEYRNLPGFRGIRVDVYILDEQGTVYDIEMQIQNTGDLPKRSRYYQGLMDSQLLISGEKTFVPLNQSYIIIISPFDLFGLGKFCYTFENICLEQKDICLGDGTKKIFLNTKGTNHEEVSDTLVKFLKYVENTTDEFVETSGDERLQNLHRSIRNIKNSETIGVSYMKVWERELQLLEEGKAEGFQESILTFLNDIGMVPVELEEKLKEQEDRETLKQWLKLAARVESIDEFISKM